MTSPRAARAVALVVVVTAIAGSAACKAKAKLGADGGARVDAAASARSDAASEEVDAAVPAEEVAPAPIATPAPAPREPPSTPFTGNYRCFKGMRLEQAGSIVTSTMHTNGTTDTIVACTVAGDSCIGTVREIQTIRGKSPKVMHVRPVTLRRAPNGDVFYRASSAEATSGTTPETYCARR